MAKIPFSDVTPPGGRSIRNIPIPNGDRKKKKEINLIKQTRTREEPVYEPVRNMEEVRTTPTQTNFRAPERPVFDRKIEEKPKRKKFLILFVIIVLILAFIIAMMTVFASATVVIKPKSQNLTVAVNLKGSTEASTSTVRYEVVKLSEQKTTSVEATGEEIAEVKASGKIKIYNNFSAEPQRLIVRTRFETKEGLLFRIPESTTVPGKTASGPGMVEVEVFADEAGEKYNVDQKTTFTIPGFKSEPERYKNFYAEASTEFTGGFMGKRRTVSAAGRQSALEAIETELQTTLQKELISKVPDGLTLLLGSIVYESKELPQKEDSSTVVLGKEVTAYAVMLNAKDLSNKLIERYISNSGDWDGIVTSITDFSGLQMTNKPENLSSGGEIDLSLSGNVVVLAEINADMIKGRLGGKPKGEAGKLIDEFDGISSITATIRPLWKQSFPESLPKIQVEIAP